MQPSGSAAGGGRERSARCPECGKEFSWPTFLFCEDHSERRLLYDRTGDVIGGKYRLLALRGRGGMAQVYCAEDTTVGAGAVPDSRPRFCAIKLIHPDLSIKARYRDRFAQEANLAYKTQSPHVAKVWEIGSDGGDLYLAMEYVDGVTLARWLRQRGPLAVDDALEIGQRIIDAIAAIQGAGAVHRDIKPDNVLIAEIEGERVVKVVDFGIAKDNARTEPLTQADQCVGTPAYMSPEQRAGASVDSRSDVFSFGCVMYEMLMGAKAYANRLLWANDESSSPEHHPGVPMSVTAFVSRCLEIDRDRRFHDAVTASRALFDLRMSMTARVANDEPAPTDDDEFARLFGGDLNLPGCGDRGPLVLNLVVPATEPASPIAVTRDLVAPDADSRKPPRTPREYEDSSLVSEEVWRMLDRRDEADAVPGIGSGFVFQNAAALVPVGAGMASAHLSNAGRATAEPTAEEPGWFKRMLMLVLGGLGMSRALSMKPQNRN